MQLAEELVAEPMQSPGNELRAAGPSLACPARSTPERGQ